MRSPRRERQRQRRSKAPLLSRPWHGTGVVRPWPGRVDAGPGPADRDAAFEVRASTAAAVGTALGSRPRWRSSRRVPRSRDPPARRRRQGESALRGHARLLATGRPRGRHWHPPAAAGELEVQGCMWGSSDRDADPEAPGRRPPMGTGDGGRARTPRSPSPRFPSESGGPMDPRPGRGSVPDSGKSGTVTVATGTGVPSPILPSRGPEPRPRPWTNRGRGRGQGTGVPAPSLLG
jgi:hypothetical protein